MTEPSGDMRMLVEQIAQALVDAPGQVQVTAVDEDQATVLELRVAATDLGKVIGKQGRTAKSIRTILRAASMKEKKRYPLEIIEYSGLAMHGPEADEFVTLALLTKTQGREAAVPASLFTSFAA